jgi:hypothetical protein
MATTKLNGLKRLTSQTNFWKGGALGLLGFILINQAVDISIRPKNPFSAKTNNAQTTAVVPPSSSIDTTVLSAAVIPAEGVQLPIVWGDLGRQMIADGVIDEQKFRALFEGGLTVAEEKMLTGNMDQPVIITQQNNRYILDLLWAFGLANKNDILENGEMNDPQYGGPENFASTGGWTLSRGSSMDHYSHHMYVVLSQEEQEKVDRVSRGVFRPCCGNSTHFPDCNHGMAMLGLLELMAKNGVSEKEMYRVALAVNSYWFPQTYIDLATYFAEQGTSWDQVDPQVVLGAEYSSAQGYQQTKQRIQSQPKPQSGGGGCGV